MRALWILLAGTAWADSGPENRQPVPCVSIQDVDLDEDLDRLRRLMETGQGAAAREQLGAILGDPLFDGWLDAEPSVGLRRLEALAKIAEDLQDLGALRDVQARIVDRLSDSLEEGDSMRLAAESGLGVTLLRLGDLEAGLRHLEHVRGIYEETLPGDHPDLLGVLQNLAAGYFHGGDLPGALALFEQVAEGRRELEPTHPDRLAIQMNIAVVRKYLGDLKGALEVEEQLHDAWTGSVAADDPNLLRSKQNLAATRRMTGNLAGALILEEYVHEVRSRTLPEDHPELLAAKTNLAATRKELGDLAGAKELEEHVVSVGSRTLPEGDPGLLIARSNLALTLELTGESDAARRMAESVLEIRQSLLPAHHPSLLTAKLHVAMMRHGLGDLEGARELEEEVVALREMHLPERHPDLLTARGNLAATLKDLGELGEALELEESVLAARRSFLPEDHFAVLRALQNRTETLARLERSDALLASALELVRLQTLRAESLYGEAPRVAREAAFAELSRLAHALSAAEILARGGVEVEELEDAVFRLLETLRMASTSSPEIAAALRRAPESAEGLERLRRIRSELNDVSLTPPMDLEGLDPWRRNLVVLSEQRDAEERSLRRRLASLGLSPSAPEVGELAAALGAGEVLISYFRYQRLGGGPVGSSNSMDSLLAFVVSPQGGLRRVELGPTSRVEEQIAIWRRDLGKPLVNSRGIVLSESDGGEDGVDRERSSGSRLRALVLDPCLAGLSPTPKSLHLVLDDALHLIPFDALPAADGGRVGDATGVRVLPSLRHRVQTPSLEEDAPHLVAIGGIDYGADAAEATTGAPEVLAPPLGGGTVQGLASVSFQALPHARMEVEVLSELWDGLGERGASVLSGGEATKRRLFQLAPRATYLHLATHGWFAPPERRGLGDLRGIDGKSTGHAEKTLLGFAPETLCGLAMAGANGGADGGGRVPGILTAEELATLDLSGCSLAVLSACETNVGLRRAGQGIHSLQSALHSAGASTAITSLWEVGDESTQRLMVEFYRAHWHHGMEMADALWGAKLALRKDGRPVREWAGWVLSGNGP